MTLAIIWIWYLIFIGYLYPYNEYDVSEEYLGLFGRWQALKVTYYTLNTWFLWNFSQLKEHYCCQMWYSGTIVSKKRHAWKNTHTYVGCVYLLLMDIILAIYVTYNVAIVFLVFRELFNVLNSDCFVCDIQNIYWMIIEGPIPVTIYTGIIM